MITSIIVAVDQQNAIGYKNRLPWHLPADLKYFAERTIGHHIIMGRHTYESIGKPLPKRTNIVVTRNPNYLADGCLVATSVTSALAMAETNGETESFLCGGTGVYQEGLNIADKLYLTRIEAEFQADTFFPEVNWSNWVERSAVFYPANDQNAYSVTFFVYNRKMKSPLANS